MPREERDKIDLERELERYMHQSHISEKNISRLNCLIDYADPSIRKFALLVRDIGIATPYRRRRLKLLAREHRDLLARYNAYFFGDTYPDMSEREWIAMMEEPLEDEWLDDPPEWEETEIDDAGAVPPREISDPFAE